MRQGCISLGEVQCDSCNRIIPYLERYLTVNEVDDVDTENEKTSHYCLSCCLKKGYAHYRNERDEQILTFFPEFPE
ncbi:hypothetical protein ACFLX8_03290 [Chloroflexota bacterium]